MKPAMTKPAQRDPFCGPLDDLRCEHCGASVKLNLPLPITVATAIIRSFVGLHQFCQWQVVFKVEEGKEQ